MKMGGKKIVLFGAGKIGRLILLSPGTCAMQTNLFKQNLPDCYQLIIMLMTCWDW
jgi:hypothetical protein